MRGRMGGMARFGTKLLLVAVAVFALWLSTFSGFVGADDVRRSILLVLYLSALLAAIYSRGRERAFWIGFFAMMPVIIFIPNGGFFVPQFGWVIQLTEPYGIGPSGSPLTPSSPSYTYSAIEDTARALWLLALSATLGYIGAGIYDRTRTEK